MTLTTGDKLPSATLTRMGADGPEQVNLSEHIAGRKVVIFAVPGAFTPTCHAQHVPSFVRAKDDLAAKGVNEVICVSVNDPFVMGKWGEDSGATAAGITMLGDADSSFTKAIGLEFSAPPAGLIDRSKRYAMVVEDGTVTVLNVEDNPGAMETSSGAAIVAAL